jgi:hypothetical protein
MFDANKAYLVTTKGNIGRADAATAQRVVDRVMREFPDAILVDSNKGVTIMRRAVSEYGLDCTIPLFHAVVIKPGDWFDRPNARRYVETRE